METQGAAWIKDVVDILQTGGPWTLVAALAWVTRYLYQARETDKAKHDEDKQKLNDRLISMAERQNDVFEKATQNQTLLLEAVNKAQMPRLPPGFDGGR